MIEPMSQSRRKALQKLRGRSILEFNEGPQAPSGTPESGTPEAEEAIKRVEREDRRGELSKLLDDLSDQTD